MNLYRVLCLAVVVSGMIVLSHTVAFAQGTPLFAVLLGGHEVSGTTANAGDENAWGGATVMLRGTTEICWAIVIAGLDTPTAAHIHKGKAGQNGDVVVTLSAPTEGSPGTSGGCTPVDAALLTDIKSNPARYYINIHSGVFPGGGLRGQLF